MSSSLARKTWEMENRVAVVDPVKDYIYGYDSEEQKKALNAARWKEE
jgi:hypothetical protein